MHLSSAFNTVDHRRLHLLIENKFLVKDTALRWFTSYLKEIKFYINIGSNLSTPPDLKYGVPQGSILGTLLFIMYITDNYDTVNLYDQGVHFYADDTHACNRANCCCQ